MRCLVTNGYKHINENNAIIITNVFNQVSFEVTAKKWLDVVGSLPPFIRNDTRISEEEIKSLKEE